MPRSSSQRRHSYQTRREKPSSPAVQNQRVAQLQGIGNQSLSSVNHLANHRFYASSAPSSTVSLNRNQYTSRPPVPLFNQSPGTVPYQAAKMMNAAGWSLNAELASPLELTNSALLQDVDLDEFTAFESGASTGFSPAMPCAMDFASSTSSSTSNLGTVSPQDLLLQEPLLSAPGSTALTSLTSPSVYNESPELDSFDVSPSFGSVEFDGSADPWYPLFPQDSNGGADQTRSLDGSPADKSEDFEEVAPRTSAGGRKKSASSPNCSARHSSVSGVSSRRRDKPLPPIIVEDPNDTVAMKRARNTLAARKSRERKAQRFEDLEDRIAKLEAERDHWKCIALAQADAQ